MTVRWRSVWPGLLLTAGLPAAEIPPPQVPESLRAPATEAVLLKATGRGKQIYGCQAAAGDPAEFEWVLKRPQAELLDAKSRKVGRHFEGPTWEATDGSKVVGEVLQRATAPRPGAVPWLLLKAKSTQGTGLFGQVTYIQRVATVGGAAPAGGCYQAHAGKEIAIDYHADYYFYASRR